MNEGMYSKSMNPSKPDKEPIAMILHPVVRAFAKVKLMLSTSKGLNKSKQMAL